MHRRLTVSLLTTLLVAAAFTPLKARIDAYVKRNFGTDIPGTKAARR